MFFVVSTGRSGTKAIAYLLSLIHGCVCLHEPAPELILESSAYRYGTITETELHKLLLETRSPRLNGSIYCESNQTLSLIVPVLAEVFPRARFIWLMRNGLDVVASAYQKQWYSGHSARHERYEDCRPLQQAWIDGRIQGDRCGDMSSSEWNRLDRFERCCWYWSYVNRIIEADLSNYAGGRFKTLRLEEIDIKVREIARWMGLKVALMPRPKRHNVAKRPPRHWTTWTDRERAVFEYWCGSLMDRFYPTWRRPSGEWQGVRSHYRSDLLSRFISNYNFVKRANALLARNRLQ